VVVEKNGTEIEGRRTSRREKDKRRNKKVQEDLLEYYKLTWYDIFHRWICLSLWSTPKEEKI
jgi:hypothetical protein